MFMVLSSWPKSSRVFTWFIWWMQTERRVAANTQTKPVDLGCECAENWQLSSTSTIAIVIINQPVSWYFFYHPTKGGRLSRPRHCSKGAQPVLKTVCRSSWRDKHNWQQRDSNLGPLTPQSDVLTTRLLRPSIDLRVIIDNKLSFNCHISAIAHKARAHASLILRSFLTRDHVVLTLTKAFVTYVRPILENCTVHLYGHLIPWVTSTKLNHAIASVGLQNVSKVCLIGLRDILSALLIWVWKLYKPDGWNVTYKCVKKWFMIKYLFLMTISWCLLTVRLRVVEDTIINCTRVIRRLTHTNTSSQAVFVISKMH